MAMWRIVSLVLLVTVTLACALQAQPASWWQPQPDAEVLLDLPMDPAAAAVAWTGAEPLTAIDDDVLGRQVLSPAKGTYLWSREPVAGDYEVEVLLRWPDPAARRTGATLFLAAEGHPNSPAYGYRVMLRPGAPGAQTLGVTVARGSVANNLLDRKPETYSPNVQSGTDPSLYDVIGRRVFFQANVNFGAPDSPPPPPPAAVPPPPPAPDAPRTKTCPDGSVILATDPCPAPPPPPPPPPPQPERG